MLFLALAIAQPVTQPSDLVIDLTIRQECPETDGEDAIVICAPSDTDPDRFRIPRSVREGGEGGAAQLPPAQIRLSEDTVVAVEAEEKDVGGTPSKRAMARLKISF